MPVYRAAHRSRKEDHMENILNRNIHQCSSMSMLPFNIRLFAENLQNPTISLTKMSCPRMILFIHACNRQNRVGRGGGEERKERGGEEEGQGGRKGG